MKAQELRAGIIAVFFINLYDLIIGIGLPKTLASTFRNAQVIKY